MPDSPLGAPLPRVDGAARVTGRVKYVADLKPEGRLHAVLVPSPAPSGRVRRVLDRAARRVPGVRLILTHENMARLAPPPTDFRGPGFPGEERQPLADDRIHHWGQHLALVVADTLEGAERAAELLTFEIAPEPFDVGLAFDDPRALAPETYVGREPLQVRRGTEIGRALAESPVRVEGTFTTPTEHHNPIETVATIAEWRRGHLYVHETSRNVQGQAKALAVSLRMPRSRVHVSCPMLGGAFGAKAFLYGHMLMVAVAARELRRPVSLVTTRRQMFENQGHRPRTIQRVELGARRDGELIGTRHLTVNDTSPISGMIEHCGLATQKLYVTEALEATHRHVPVPLPPPVFMRGPGEAPGPFALESAMDELARELGMDPVDLRLRNDTPTDGDSGKPWSLRQLRECFARASERFGWAERDPEPRSMRAGRDLVGYGCAAVTYRATRSGATVRATMNADGTVLFRTAAHDVGVGTATAMGQVAAAELGIPFERVSFKLGDSDDPEAPAAGASRTAATIGEATVAAARKLRIELSRRGDGPLPKGGITVEAKTEAEPEKEPFAFHSWGAVFAEVRVDEELGTVRVARIVGVYDIGRVLNPRLVDSQLRGGIVFGMGMALYEHTVVEARQGKYLNHNLGEYLLPTNADVPALDVSWLGTPDPHFGTLGVHGVGEVGVAGTPGAIANAVFHATGKRVRDLPIMLDKLL